MKKFALIGKGISHSLSPALFKAAGGCSDGSTYDLIETSDLKKAMSYFNSAMYLGANITAPYKEDILFYCNEYDHGVIATGASNLIIKSGDSFKAYNTDTNGAYDPFEKRGTQPSNVLIVGAGGAAKAAAYIFKKKGFKVSIANRSSGKTKSIAGKFDISFADLQDLHNIIGNFNVLVYTVPVLLPQIENLPLDNLLVAEANYRHPVLNKKKCKEYISGLEWLVHQAIPGFRLFTGKNPDTKAMFELADNS